MSKETITSLNKKLVENEHARVIVEQKIKDNQKLLQDLHEEFEKDLETLKDLQDSEESLRKEISNQQKEDLNDTLSLESMRKMLGKAVPLFSKIKNSTVNKAKDVKSYIDANTDKKWIEQKYNEYKTIAVKKGEDIKSREDFQKIALSVKNVQGEIQELNLYDIINKLSTDAGHASKAIKKAVKNIKIEEKVEAITRKKDSALDEESGNKLDIFTEWASHKSVDLNEAPESLYSNYMEYLSKKYSDLDINTIAYTKKAGSFTKALNKYKKSLETN
jgi:hypothetical protein